MDVSCHRPFLPDTSLEPAVISTLLLLMLLLLLLLLSSSLSLLLLASPNFSKCTYRESTCRSVLPSFWRLGPHAPVKFTHPCESDAMVTKTFCDRTTFLHSPTPVAQPNNFHAKLPAVRTERTGRTITQFAKQGELVPYGTG